MIKRFILLQGFAWCLLLLKSVHAFPSLLVQSASGCMTEFSPEEVIMNNEVVAYKDSPHPDVKIIVKQNEQWRSGPIVVNSDELPVALTIKLEVPSSLKDVQYAVESSQGGFFPKEGGCEGKRRAASMVHNNPGLELVVESLPVHVVAAWATGHEAVSLTDTVQFTSSAPAAKVEEDAPPQDQQDAVLKLAEDQRKKASENSEIIAKTGEDTVDANNKNMISGEEDIHHFELPHPDMGEFEGRENIITSSDLHVHPTRSHAPKKVYKSEHDETPRRRGQKNKHVLHGYHLDEYIPNVDFMRFAYGGIFLVGAILVLLLGFESLSGGRKHKGRRDL